MNDYNAFIQANTNVVKVYVPKSVRLNGGSVLAPYQITRGTLLEVVNGVGFTSVASTGSSVGDSGSVDRAIEDGAAVWIHSREDGTGGLKVSTQFMYVDNSVLAGYQTAEAMEVSADSYGGINAQAVYLQPRSGVGHVGGGVVPVVPAGGNTASGNENENENQNGGGTGGGSQTGGDTGGGNDNPPAGDGSGDEG